MKGLLYPVSELYGALTWARNTLYNRKIFSTYHSKLPVISVGNIAAGGTGKTPIAIYLAEELKSRGYSPVILSRGYGGSEKGPYRLNGDESASLCGDEPLLMARRNIVPVVIARSRSEGAKFIERDKCGDLIILDDGFQHRRLHRNIDIVLIDVTTKESIEDVVSGRLLPYGRLREPRDEGLRRADIIILNERRAAEKMKEPPPELLKLIGTAKGIYLSVYKAEGVRSISNSEELKPCEIVAFCGIARPQGYFETLETLGFKIIGRREFSDHHPFSKQDIDSLRATYPEVPLVCTEKDMVKLGQLTDNQIYYLKTSASIIPSAPLIDRVIGALKNR